MKKWREGGYGEDKEGKKGKKCQVHDTLAHRFQDCNLSSACPDPDIDPQCFPLSFGLHKYKCSIIPKLRTVKHVDYTTLYNVIHLLSVLENLPCQGTSLDPIQP